MNALNRWCLSKTSRNSRSRDDWYGLRLDLEYAEVGCTMIGLLLWMSWIADMSQSTCKMLESAMITSIKLMDTLSLKTCNRYYDRYRLHVHSLVLWWWCISKMKLVSPTRKQNIRHHLGFLHLLEWYISIIVNAAFTGACIWSLPTLFCRHSRTK